ncbi:unnamed protein product [Lymnaea stagnalis]|uniref:Kaptin n=1 Tax=Lymnaea stagnalis TaxID=6523 RepID=A0AAV2I5A4_LYMST
MPYKVTMAAKQLYWTDAHFCGLRSQTNIYGLSKIASQDGLTKLLAVSIDGHFVSVEYQKSFDNRLIPITKEDVFFDTSNFTTSVFFSGEIEIVSVDVICQNLPNNRMILAISYLKLEASYEDKPPSAYMNIYFLPERETDVAYTSIVDAINQSQIQYLSLDFIPFKLMHHEFCCKNGQSETCLLLSGNDNKIHVYRQTDEGLSFYEETEAFEEHFPEFAKIDGCVTQMEFRKIDDANRLTVIGIQSGLVTLSLVNPLTKEIKQTWSSEMDSPITSLQLFTQRTHAQCPDFLDPQEDPQADGKETNGEEINLLITSAIDPAAVFCDVVNCGLSRSHILPLSNTQDVVLCSRIVDIDFDGENEILIGTYGQVLLAYKLIHERPQAMLMTSTPFQSPMPVPINDTFASPYVDERYNSDQDKSETRRRHKTDVSDICDRSSKFDKPDWQRTDESSHVDESLKNAQMARLVRSQENLAMTSPRSVCFHTPDSHVTSALNLPPNSYVDLTDYPGYRLTWTKRFSDPVMGLDCEDVMGDGMLDLIVLTLKGLHILQPDLNDVAALLLEKLQLICDSGSEPDDDYLQLQTELLEEER